MTLSTHPAVQPASLRGMALGIAAYTLFSFHDAIVKLMVHDLPVVQILFVRSVVVAALCLGLGRGSMVRTLMVSPNKKMILMRGLLTLAAWIMYYSAGRYLQLAEMTTLYYFAPVLTIVLAVIFLGEKLTPTRIGAALVGFVGVVIACNPTALTFGFPALLVLGAALCWAIAMILMRTISKSESSLVQVFAQNLLFVIAMAAASLPFWQQMEPWQLGLAIAAGLIGGFAQYILVDSARLVPASVLGTVEYGALIWSFVLGYLIWREQPAQTVYLGAALVICAGLLLAWNESRARREIIDAP